MINLSSRFREILIRLSRYDNISKFILNLEDNNDYVYPFSYLDITDSEDQISFIQSNKFKQITQNNENKRNINELLWSSSSRNEVKIGRLIIKLAPNFKPIEIEKFVNLYKAERKNMLKNIKFKIVDGEDIIKYYNGRRYDKGSGSLNKSCMRYDQCANYLDLYKLNSDKIKMLILLDSKNDLLKGRAILWKLNNPNDTWFLDRIYTIDESDTFLFKKHAEKNGWLFKNEQTFDAVNVVKDNQEVFIEMRVNIKGDFEYFPYIDTLLYYNKKQKYLTNLEKDYIDNSEVVKLREINGQDSGNENFVFDIVNNVFINVDDSIYCYYGDGYTHKNNAIFIKKIDEYCLPAYLRYSTYYGEFLNNRESVYSYKLKSFVKKNDIHKVFLSKDKTTFDYFLKKEIEQNFVLGLDGNYYLKTLMIKGIDDVYYFKDEYDEELIKKIKNQDRYILDEAIKSSKILRELIGDKIKPRKENHEDKIMNYDYRRWWEQI